MPLFSPHERAAFEALKKTSGPLYDVLAKTKLSDVLEVRGSGLVDADYQYATKSHFDFVVVSSDDMAHLAIECDFSDKDYKRQQQADLKDRICSEFDVPLIRLDCRHISREAIPKIITNLLNGWDPDHEGADPLIRVEPESCLLHFGKCQLSMCKEFQRVAEQLFLSLEPSGCFDSTFPVTARLRTTSAPDSYFKSELILLSGDTELPLAEGRCRCSAYMHRFAITVSQRLAWIRGAELLGPSGHFGPTSL